MPTRKPPLTRKAISRLLSVASMAQADADAMDGGTPQEREHQKELNEGCEYIRQLARWWVDHHPNQPIDKRIRNRGASGQHKE